MKVTKRIAVAIDSIEPRILYAHDLRKSYGALEKEKLALKSLGLLSAHDYCQTSCFAENVRRTELVFILGSGVSIAHMTESQWRVIARHASIGINRWFLHEFDPTFFMFEGLREHDARSPYGKWYQESIKRYRLDSSAIFLLKNISTSLFDWDFFSTQLPKKNYGLPLLAIPGRSEKSFKYSLKKIVGTGQAFDNILFRRGSVSAAVSLAVNMGFKSIVLCGVDCVGNEFFWEDTTWSRCAGARVPASPASTLPIHGTMNPEVDPVTMDKVLSQLSDVLLKPNGVQLFVGSSYSALAKKFPIYEWMSR